MNAMKRLSAVLAAVVLSGPVLSGTVAWYRFEEMPSGTRTTGESTIVNSADPGKLSGKAYVQTPILWTGARQLLEPAELMPLYTDGFDPLFKIFDPVAGTFFENDRALFMATADNTKDTAAGSTFLVADDASLHLNSFTVEFFVKIPEADYGTVERWYVEKRCNDGANRSWAVWFKQGRVYAGIDTVDEEGTHKSYTVYDDYTDVNDGKWHHVAFVVNDETKKLRIVVDHATTVLYGQETSYEGAISYANGGPVTFSQADRYYGMFERTLDEVRITDRALAPSEFLRAVPADPSPAAEPETLVYLDFEGGVSRTLEDFPAAVTVVPALQNKAPYHEGYAVDAVTYAKSSAVNAAPAVFPADPARSNTGCAGSDRFAPNTASLQVLTNAVDNDWTQCVVLPATITRDMLFGDDVTIEFSFKMPKPSKNPPGEEGICSKSDSTQLVCMLGGFGVMIGRSDSWDYGYLRCSVGTNNLKGTWAQHPTLVTRSCADGLWHRCVVTYDHTAARAEFFLDGVLQLSGEEIGFPDLGNFWSGYRREFMVGGSFYDSWYIKNVTFDDVRITRGVLAPARFLDESYPADVNGTEVFMSLQEAIDAAGEGDTVNLRRDETIADGIAVNGKTDLTIDLKGHTLLSSTTGYVLDIEGSTLTIADSGDGGRIVKDSQTTIVQVGRTSAATLTLAGGGIVFAGENPVADDPSSQASGSCVSVREFGRFVMTGGELDDGGDANEWAIRASDGGVAEFSGGIVKGGVQDSTSAGAVRIVKASTTLFDENPMAAEDGRVVIHRKYHMEQVGGEGEYADFWHAVPNPPVGFVIFVR